MGAVREVHRNHMLVSLPNMLTGVIRKMDIVEDPDSDDEDDATVDESEDPFPMPTIFPVGTLLPCSVFTLEEKSNTQVRLTLKPHVINSGCDKTSFVKVLCQSVVPCLCLFYVCPSVCLFIYLSLWLSLDFCSITFL